MSRKKPKPPAPPGLGIIDSHAHLDGRFFGEDRDEALARAWEAGLGGIVLMASAGAAEVFREVADLVETSTRLWMVAGVHPHDAQHVDDLWGPLLAVVDEGRCVAIGETGLDHFYDHSPRREQVRSFEKHIALALERALPLVLHVRDAHEDALGILDAVAPAWRGVVHCFTGGPAEAEDWLSRGFHPGGRDLPELWPPGRRGSPNPAGPSPRGDGLPLSHPDPLAGPPERAGPGGMDGAGDRVVAPRDL